MTSTPLIGQSTRFLTHSTLINASLGINPFTTVTDITTGPLFVITTTISQSSDTSAPEVSVRGVPRCPRAGRC